MRNKLFFSFLILFLCLESASVYAQSLSSSAAAADDAERRLDEALSGTTRQSTAPVQVTSGRSRPNWVNNPSSAYPRDRYITAVGSASNRTEAENRAFAALASFFGQSIRADYAIATIYSEAVSNGIINVSENTNVRDTIVTAVSMDKLIGAEIGNVWDDGRGTIYALAFLETERTVVIYTEIIRMNQRNIDNLTSISAAEKNTFDGFARYKLAALLAGMNVEYAGIISLAGGSTSSLNLTGTETLTRETSDIIRNISVGFNIKGDHNNRVRDAFAKVLSGEGLRTQGASATLYVLEINVDMSEVTFPDNNYIFCRYTVSANLIERSTGSVLFPFTINDRAGHSTYEAAQARAFMDIERLTAERYPVLFREYLAALLPQ